MSPEKQKALIEANKLLKKEWPAENLQISFNLAQKHSNVNFNIKESGILNPERVK